MVKLANFQHTVVSAISEVNEDTTLVQSSDDDDEIEVDGERLSYGEAEKVAYAGIPPFLYKLSEDTVRRSPVVQTWDLLGVWRGKTVNCAWRAFRVAFMGCNKKSSYKVLVPNYRLLSTAYIPRGKTISEYTLPTTATTKSI